MHWRVWGMKGKKDNLPLNYNLKSILTRDVWTGQGRDDKDELHSIKANTGVQLRGGCACLFESSKLILKCG